MWMRAGDELERERVRFLISSEVEGTEYKTKRGSHVLSSAGAALSVLVALPLLLLPL